MIPGVGTRKSEPEKLMNLEPLTSFSSPVELQGLVPGGCISMTLSSFEEPRLATSVGHRDKLQGQGVDKTGDLDGEERLAEWSLDFTSPWT